MKKRIYNVLSVLLITVSITACSSVEFTTNKQPAEPAGIEQLTEKFWSLSN